MKDKQRSEERKHEFRRHKEKKGWVKSKANKELDKWLEEETRSEKKEEERETKNKQKCTEVNLALMFFCNS